MADSSGVFVRRSSEESRHRFWHFPSTFAVTIITALEIKCAVEGGGRHGRDGALITSLIVVDRPPAPSRRSAKKDRSPRGGTTLLRPHVSYFTFGPRWAKTRPTFSRRARRRAGGRARGFN